VIAQTIGFSRADLLDTPFDELCLVWLPEVMRMAREAGQ
jgi:hypothetical protein